MPFVFSDTAEFGEGWELKLINEAEATNQFGTLYAVELQAENVSFKFPKKEWLERELQLIYGIGPTTAAKLNEAGYYTLNDLTRHTKWGKAAIEILRIISTKDYSRLARYGASDLQLLSFFEPEEIIFIDIETLGLYYIHPVFLVGMLSFKEGQGKILQLLARNPIEEKALLFDTINWISKATIIVSFNGRSFDVPYLKGRMRFQGLDDVINAFHFDLLRQTRKNYRSQLPNCRLLTIERHLFHQERIDDLPGSQVAEYYQRYLDSEDWCYLKPILEHNACDLLSMAKLLGLITTELPEVS